MEVLKVMVDMGTQLFWIAVTSSAVIFLLDLTLRAIS